MLEVNFEKVDGGFFLTIKDTKNLDINLERLNIYIYALETMIDVYRYKGDEADAGNR